MEADEETRSSFGLGAETAARRSPGGYASSPPGDAWAAGQRIGRYRLGKPLGRGGMGVVYVADDELLDRVVALKVLRPDRASSGISRVLREAQSLARLSHPHVVQVYDVSTYDSQIFIAMEFIAGGTLRQWLEAENRSFDTILEVFLQAGRGLAAAHNVGIIHRDFKPDNVLIGADGRARVADFGLAAEQPQFASNVTVTSEDDERLTRAGTILGTPRYMSPEHREGGNLDARADQFSFCVALYEALYAAHPFPEVGAAATPPKGEGLWVWPLLKRGLQPRPDDRFSGLLELLAALERNPALLRKRRLRLAGFLLLSVAIAAALTLGGLNVAQRWQAAALEDESARAYASAEERIERAIHAGHNEEAERIFRAFVEEPIYGETQVVSQAWLARAKRRAKARDLDGARAAAAYAYTHGKTPAQRRSALLVLGRVFERDFDWAGLSELLNLLDREGLTTADEGEYQRLRGAATFGQRELATAAQLDVGPARALAGATSTPYHVIARTEEVEVEGEPLLLLMSFEGGYVTIYAVSATPELDERWRHEFGYLPRVIVAGKRPFLIAGRGGGEPLNTLYEVHKDGLVEVSKFEGAPPTCAALSDLDGDGEDELYFSTGLDLEVARIDLLHPGASAPHVVVDTRGTLESYGQNLLALSIDGEPALALALRGFRALDVRILQRGPNGTLETRFRKKIGTIIGMSKIQRLGETLLVVANVPWDKDPSTLSPEHPYGEPPGLHLFRVNGDGLKEVLYLPVALKEPSNAKFEQSFVGDFNGDGREDLAFNVLPHETRQTIFFLQHEDGSFTSSVLGDSDFRGALELDGDRGKEALLNIFDEHDTMRLWVLGSGEEDIPTPAHPDLPPGLPPAENDPRWVRRWSDTVDLGQLGLRKLAAAGFDQLANDAVMEASQVAALRWAAAMRTELGDDEGKFSVLQRLVSLEPDTSTLEELYRLARFLGDYDEAREALSTLLERTPQDAATYEPELERLALLGAGEQIIETRFDRPLGSQWVIEQPTSLHRRPTDAVLEVATSSAGVLAWLPIEWDGNFLEIEVDLLLRHTEWGTGFHVEVVPEEDPEGTSILSFEVDTLGTSRGGLLPVRLLSCISASQGHPIFAENVFPTGTDEPLRLRAKGRLAPVIGEVGCSVTGEGKGQNVSRRQPLASTVAAGAYRVILKSAVGVPSLLHVDLYGITVRGASLRTDEGKEVMPTVAHALVEGDYRGALAQADTQGSSAGSLAQRMMLSEAMVLSGRLEQVQATWRELLTSDDPQPELDAIVTAQLRRSPQLYGSLLNAVSPPERVRRVAAAWRNFAVNHRERKELQPHFWEAINNVDVDASDLPKDAVDILHWRARLLSEVGNHRAGLRELERALARIDATAVNAPVRAETWAISLSQAKLAIRAGKRQLAIQAIKRARASATMPLLVEDRIRADPDLAPIATAK